MPGLLRLSHHAGQRDRRGGRRCICRRRAAYSCRPKAKWARPICSSAAASAGVRAMSASSGPGISLMQEGFSYIAGAELPCVIGRYHARRPGTGQHRARAGRLQPGRQGRRPWQLSHAGAGARFGAGNGRPDHPGLRPGRRVPQPRGAAGRWLYRPDDGAGRLSPTRFPSRRRPPGPSPAPPRPGPT